MRDEWYVARRGQGENARYGPVPLRQLRQLLDDGKVHGDDLVWCEGMANWQRADRCDALFPAPRPGYDDRPYVRRPPPQSSGWVGGLVVGGVIVAFCFLACAGIGAVGFLGARSGPAFGPPVAPPMVNVPPLAPVPDDGGAIFNPNFNGGLPGALGQKIAFKTSELFYTANVTAEEAQVVGNYLDDNGAFPDDHAVTVQLDKPLGAYQVRFCVKPGAADDADVLNYYRDIRSGIADKILPGTDVEVHLCDQNMVTMRVLRAGD